MATKSWGTGRKDYSEMVELSTIPVIRSWEQAAKAYAEISVPAGETVETEILVEGGGTHYIFDIYISVTANVLIRTTIYQSGILFLDKYGYQFTDWDVTAGIPFDQLTLRIINYGGEDVTAYYTHHGVYGVEAIEPKYIPPRTY